MWTPANYCWTPAVWPHNLVFISAPQRSRTEPNHWNTHHCPLCASLYETLSYSCTVSGAFKSKTKSCQQHNFNHRENWTLHWANYQESTGKNRLMFDDKGMPGVWFLLSRLPSSEQSNGCRSPVPVSVQLSYVNSSLEWNKPTDVNVTARVNVLAGWQLTVFDAGWVQVIRK